MSGFMSKRSLGGKGRTPSRGACEQAVADPWRWARVESLLIVRDVWCLPVLALWVIAEGKILGS